MRKLAALLLLLTIACAKTPPAVNPQPPPPTGFHSKDEARMEATSPTAPTSPAVPAATLASATVKPNTAFQIAADHTGAGTTEFWLEKAGVVVEKKPTSALSAEVMQFALASGVPEGTHEFAVRAVRIVPQGTVEETFGSPWQGTVVAGEPFVVTTTVPTAPAPTFPVTQMKLYRANVVVQTQPATSSTVTFSVTGLPTGAAEFKISAVSTASAETTLASPALDATIKVISTTQTVSPWVSASPSSVVPSVPQTVSWSCTTNCGTIGKDWIGLFPAGQVGVVGADLWWPGTYLVVPGSGSFVRNAPTTAGNYVWAYCLNDGYNCTAQFPFTVTATPVEDKPCEGTWSEWVFTPWTSCVNNTQERTGTRTFTVTQQPTGNGQACPGSPESKVETQVCSAPTNPAAPAMNACRWTLRGTPPDSTLGWRAQFRENGANVGSRDNTAPYDRQFNYTAGVSRSVDIVWSKTSTSVPTQTSLPLVLTCK